jgi:hypothetical protein
MPRNLNSIHIYMASGCIGGVVRPWHGCVMNASHISFLSLECRTFFTLSIPNRPVFQSPLEKSLFSAFVSSLHHILVWNCMALVDLPKCRTGETTARHQCLHAAWGMPHVHARQIGVAGTLEYQSVVRFQDGRMQTCYIGSSRGWMIVITVHAPSPELGLECQSCRF